MYTITTASALQTALENCRPEEDLTTQSVAAMKKFSDIITEVKDLSTESKIKLEEFIKALEEKIEKLTKTLYLK